MNKSYTDIEIKTKAIYVEQHKNYYNDSTIFNRHLAAAQDLATYDLPENFFKGKSVLDAGCGNSGYFQLAMFNLGAKKVTCLDIGEEWKLELSKILLQKKIPDGFCDFISGSTTRMPFKDESFDFVASNGVLMHLETIEMADEAIAELSRVAKKGGVVYSHIGIDKPGIVDRYIVKALRSAYQEDEEFRSFIDTINPKLINSAILEFFNKCSKYDPRLAEIPEDLLDSLITLDSTTFWQNMLQVPIQQGPKLSEQWGMKTMSKHGLENIRRPAGTYWIRNDFRRYLAPIHFSLDSSLARLFYGNGHVKLIADKP